MQDLPNSKQQLDPSKVNGKQSQWREGRSDFWNRAQTRINKSRRGFHTIQRT